jgi:hypothetical protein
MRGAGRSERERGRVPAGEVEQQGAAGAAQGQHQPHSSSSSRPRQQSTMQGRSCPPAYQRECCTAHETASPRLQPEKDSQAERCGSAVGSRRQRASRQPQQLEHRLTPSFKHHPCAAHSLDMHTCCECWDVGAALVGRPAQQVVRRPHTIACSSSRGSSKVEAQERQHRWQGGTHTPEVLPLNWQRTLVSTLSFCLFSAACECRNLPMLSASGTLLASPPPPPPH